MPLLEHKGNAVDTCRLNAMINNTATSADLDTTPTNWPTGGANGKFYVTFNLGGANEESILCSSRSGVTLNFLLADRGKDGTVATDHQAGETVHCTFPAEEAHDYNQHLYVPGRDDHTQYMLAAGGRHDLAARHTFSTLSWAPGTPTAITANQAGAVGTGAHPSHSDHVHPGPVTATPVAIGTALSAGSGTDLALANHVHELGTGSIDLANMFAAGVVDSNALGAASVIAGKLANGAINVDTLLVDALFTSFAKIGLFDPTSYAPAASTFSDGAGGAITMGTGGTTYGYYYKLGRLVFGSAGFAMAADGNLPSGSNIRIPLPFTQRSLTTMRPLCAVRARVASVPAKYSSGLGVIQAGNNYAENIATAGANAEWDATVPWNWGTPGEAASATVDAFFFMISTT